MNLKRELKVKYSRTDSVSPELSVESQKRKIKFIGYLRLTGKRTKYSKVEK
ncbi:MAG: hypothetical protein ACP5LN_09565 [Thermoproteota archaeon]